MLLYEEKIYENKTAFIEKVVEISRKLDIDPNWLMFVMNSESGINHLAVNPMGGATGLIQFMPNTAIALGTTTSALLKMSNVEQLDYVYKFLSPYKRHFKQLTDLYLTIFFPMALGKGDDFIIQTVALSASLIARQNPIFDTNKDGKITVGEFRQAVVKKIPANWYSQLTKKKA